MSDELVIREMEAGEEEAASELVVRVFNEFVGPGYSEEGRNTFLEYASPAQALSLRRMRPMYFFLTAWLSGRLVGVIEIRDLNHISLFFVDKSFHGRGIARVLLDASIERIKRERTETVPLTVNSSPYAVPIYGKMGFVATSGERLSNGILFQPMSLDIE